MRRASTSYTPRRPHDTVLHRLVREHYATFVAHAEATYAAPLPRYVTDAFERYLACADFSPSARSAAPREDRRRRRRATRPRPRPRLASRTPQANGSANVPPSSFALSPVSAAPAPGTAPSVANPVPLAFEAIASEDPTTITVEHWRRLLDGELFATSSRVDWAILMQRTFGFDALRCPRCDQKMRVLSTITEPVVVKKILSHLGMRTDPLPRARARDPTGQMDFGDYAA